jgi:hypothetical protein
MGRWIHVLGRFAPRALPGFVPLALASVAFSTPPAGPLVAYDPAPTALVASVHEALGEVADADPGPSIEVFGDGRVAVHFPHYMTRAGDWTDHLSPAELQRLLRALVDDGLLDLDERAARAALARARSQQRAAALRGEATVVEASDPSTTTITVHAEGRARTVVWRGLRADAHTLPEVAEVQRLRRAHDTLQTLATRPGLRRVP